MLADCASMRSLNTTPFTKPGFLDAATCGRVRIAMSAGSSEPAEVLHADVALDRGSRHASSVEVDHLTLERVEHGLEKQRGEIGRWFGLLPGEREGAGFLRYGAGGFYRPHRDRAASAAWPAAAKRRIAVVVFLSADLYGGALRLIEPDSIEIPPQEGLLVAFRADVLHEVLPVESGTRDVVVDWFY